MILGYAFSSHPPLPAPKLGQLFNQVCFFFIPSGV